ncbi:unnamed protein product [Phyllotreta striolata]|uniref:Epoxide hydrolase n=1 Tax=Phyllotreta striolata TaxID=444603 RepID=A0A9N9TK97_PHYSR|nr:unnamed protein product [Phyllotreta striolata]
MVGCKCLMPIMAIPIALVWFWAAKLMKEPSMPAYNESWWGPGEPRYIDDKIRPFEISVSDEILKDLKYRLEHTLPLQPALKGTKHTYGINTNLLQKVLHFWKNEYNWTEREAYLNQFPQFLVNIQGLDIHFIHVKPKVPKSIKVLPLLILHGWVGSVREMYEIIPKLTTPKQGKNFVFEVIVPSLPGFAFSDGAAKKGMGSFNSSVVMKNLMKRLGFERFYVQGTDWGASIVQAMSVMYPDKVIAMHSNMCIVNMFKGYVTNLIYAFYPTFLLDEEELKSAHMYTQSIDLSVWFYRIEETGYFHLQATKPDSLGVALRDSPIGLAAYLLEKFITLTKASYRGIDDGRLEETYGMTALIDNIMLYWITGSITTSMRIYAEHWSSEFPGNFDVDGISIQVPAGCARFEHDIVFYPKAVLKVKYPNLIHASFYEAGHFPALEVPDVLVDDIFEFFDKVMKL